MEYDICIVSAFSRGDWLASDLQKSGLKVLFIDQTSFLGNWPIEDIEGPFGFFRSEKYSQSYLEWASQFYPTQEVPQGLTLWLADGPLELKSALTQHRMRALNVTREEENPGANKFQDFSTNWLSRFSRAFASTRFNPGGEIQRQQEPLPLFNNFAYRIPTRQAMESSLKWLKEKNIDVSSQEKILDLSLFGKAVSGIELKGPVRSGLVKFQQVLWLLSSEETHWLNEKLGLVLFPKGLLEPDWCWLRYRLKVQDCVEVRNIPPHLVLIDDLYSPWAHENFLVLQKTSSSENLDLWMRIPTVQRFNKVYLTKRGEALCEILNQRMPRLESGVHTYPQEYYYTYKDLGASRYPVFNSDKQVSKVNFRNVHRGDNEVLINYSSDAVFSRLVQCRDKIIEEWKRLELQRKKKENSKEVQP